MSDPRNILGALVARDKERTASAEHIYAALAATKQLGKRRLITYRCADRCLLLDVVQTPDQIIWHQSSYKHSPEWFEARWSASGRQKNSDGQGRSFPHTFDARSAANLELQCKHLAVTLGDDDYGRHVSDGWRKVIVSSDGNMKRGAR